MIDFMGWRGALAPTAVRMPCQRPQGHQPKVASAAAGSMRGCGLHKLQAKNLCCIVGRCARAFGAFTSTPCTGG